MTEKLLKLAIEQWGEEKGRAVFARAKTLYADMLPLTQGEPKDCAKNMMEKIFPIAAIYKALLEQEDGEQALEEMFSLMDKQTRRASRPMYEKMGRLPFFFPLFETMFSKGLQGKSWDVEFVRKDKECFFYDIKRCLWADVTAKLGVPELCSVFCRNDNINFTDVSPRLHFVRTKTLGGGDDCCDFRFYRHDPQK